MAEPDSMRSARKIEAITTAGEAEIDLAGLFFRLLKNLKYLIAAALLGALISAVCTVKFVTPIYEATAKLYVMNSSDSVLNLSDLQIGSYLASDYQEVFKAWEVHQMVRSNLKLAYTDEELQRMLKIVNPTNTRILNITVRSANPRETMDIANEYASVAKEYISRAMATDQPNILSSALLPVKPVSPNLMMNTILGFLAGLFLAAVVVVTRFMGDDRLKTADDVRNFADMPTLALIPVFAGAGIALDRNRWE
jgi:capsular polysaccharide biosynthesis protein